jgi:predicted nuclease with TOPRIM domain
MRKRRKKMKALPDFEKRQTILRQFNKLIDEKDAAWIAIDNSDDYCSAFDEIQPRIEELYEELSALTEEVRKTDPELYERLWPRRQERFRLRPTGEKARQKRQAEIEQQGCKCAECGGPLDINQQMMGMPPNICCDFCCVEMIEDTDKYGELVA